MERKNPVVNGPQYLENAIFVQGLIVRKLVELGGTFEDVGLLYEEDVAEVVARAIWEWKCSHGG